MGTTLQSSAALKATSIMLMLHDAGASEALCEHFGVSADDAELWKKDVHSRLQVLFMTEPALQLAEQPCGGEKAVRLSRQELSMLLNGTV